MEDEADPITKALSVRAREFLAEIADFGIGQVVGVLTENTDVLKEIPVMKWLVLAYDIGSKIQTAFFVKKYANFIGPIAEAMADDPKEHQKLRDLFSSDKNYRRLIEYSIIEIDRYQTELKAKLLGILFAKTFKEHIFDAGEYNEILFSIDYMHPHSGIGTLRKYYEGRVRTESENDEASRRQIWTEIANIDYSPLATTGFLRLPVGGAYAGNIGGATISELGMKFYEHVVMNCPDCE